MKLLLSSPPWTKLGKKLESLVRKAIFDFSLFKTPTHIGVALSGGKDSLTMLCLLNALKERGFLNLDITAIHVEKRFSQGSICEHTQFLQKVCDELQVPFISKPSYVDKETLECYMCSRKRRKILFDTAKELGIDTIALGHHREDNIQTLMLNLLHKGEFAGMLPKIKMIHYDVTIIRPLIYIKEPEIIEFAKSFSFKPVTCTCPRNNNSRRKEVEDLLCHIEKMFPHVRGNLSSGAFLYGSQKAQKR